MSTRRIVLAVTDSRSALLVRGQLAYLAKRGFEVHLVSGPGRHAVEVTRSEAATHHVLELHRDLSPAADLRATRELFRLFRSLRPVLVDGSTPKAGLLAMLAATAARVPVKVHTLRGLRHTTLTPPRSTITWAGHRLTCQLANRVVCVSHSLRAQAIELGITNEASSVVLGDGSGNGVDLVMFSPTDERRAAALALRHAWSPNDAPIVGFVGRLAGDKGLAELAHAWELVAAKREARLVIVGTDDPTDPVAPSALEALRHRNDVVWPGERDDMAPVYLACDVIVMPSRREGLNNVLLEAAAMERPTVTTNTPGCRDAIVDAVTGTLVEPLDPVGLAGAVEGYLADPDLRARHGRAGRRRIVESFSSLEVHRRIADEYERLIAAS